MTSSKLCVFALALNVCGLASASTLAFHGALATDDALKLFSFSVAAASNVTIHTLSYGGGIAAGGIAIPKGGFDTNLTLFDGTGLILDSNGYGGSDASLSETAASALQPGSYTVALTEVDNYAIGPYLSDGFTRSGQGNFTGHVCGSPGSSFLEIDNCTQRTANWELEISTSAVPEPENLSITVMALLALGIYRARRNTRPAAK